MKIINFTKNPSNIIDEIKSNKKSINMYNRKIFYYIILFYIINLTKEDTSISKIILTIKGKGNQQILHDSSSKSCSHDINYPDIVYVNNISQENINLIVYNLTEEIHYSEIIGFIC